MNKAQTADDMTKYNLTIDYLDVVAVSKLKMPNEDAAGNEETYVRENYKWNFSIQIEVSAVNGLSVLEKKVDQHERDTKKKVLQRDEEEPCQVLGIKNAIQQRSNIPIANVFFRCQHEDDTASKHLLINPLQGQVCDYIIT